MDNFALFMPFKHPELINQKMFLITCEILRMAIIGIIDDISAAFRHDVIFPKKQIKEEATVTKIPVVASNAPR